MIMKPSLALLIILSLSTKALGCGPPKTVAVTWVANGTKGNIPTAYDVTQVLESMQGGEVFTGAYLSSRTTTFSCVDSRAYAPASAPALQTPGGDLSELQAAIVIYHRMRRTNATASSVHQIFKAFMKAVITSTRPFYYHTADSFLQRAFSRVKTLAGLDHAPVVLPDMLPKNKTLADAWLHALSESAAQGCGHIRYMMQNSSMYGLVNDHEVHVSANLIRSYYSHGFGWTKSGYNKGRTNVDFPILHGGLNGHAAVIVSKKDKASCKGLYPEATPSHGGSQVFLYQADAVAEFRQHVLTPFFVRYAGGSSMLNATAFYNHLTALQGTQLGATLTLLSPINAIGLWSATVA